VAKAGGDAVVDCPPLDPPQVVRTQEVGDILLFPFKPGGNDLRAFSRALSLHQAKREQAGSAAAVRPKMFALINEFMHGQLNERLLHKWVEESGIFYFVGCLGRRVEFKDAIAKRQAVWEYAPDSQSAKEALAVCEALHRRAQWGSEVAAAKLTGYLIPQTCTLYTHEDPKALILRYRLRPDPAGPIEILKAFWEPGLPQGPAPYEDVVHPLLVVADLKAIDDPRTNETARMIHDKFLA